MRVNSLPVATGMEDLAARFASAVYWGFDRIMGQSRKGIILVLGQLCQLTLFSPVVLN